MWEGRRPRPTISYPCAGSSLPQAVADQRGVVGDQRVAWDLRPDRGARAGWAVDRELSVERADAVGEALQAAAVAKVAPPRPSSTIATMSRPSSGAYRHGRGVGVCVLGDVRERFGDDEVGGALDRRGVALSVITSTLIGNGARSTRLPTAADEPVVGQDRGVDAAGELAQLVERRL